MLSIEELKKIDPSLKELSDEEVAIVRARLYEMVQLSFDSWWEDKNGSKRHTGLSLNDEDKSKIYP